jgi:CubicO group peptidase (beta-lactamase class C family)
MYSSHLHVFAGLALHILLVYGARLVATDQPQAFLGPAASTSANAGVNAEMRNVTQQELITPGLDTWISGLLKEWNSPGGLSMAVVKQHDDDEWVETRGYGLAREDGTKADENILFGIGSNSKVRCRLQFLTVFYCTDIFFFLSG